jgi:signal transduction histidine kinase
MQRTVGQRVAAERVTNDCAEAVAAAAGAAAQAERSRLARDLHDSVTQTLISLHLSAQAAIELWDTQPARARTALDTVRHLAAGATTEMRALLVDLNDAVLAQQGLVGALEAQCAIVRQHSGLQVELCAALGTPLPPAHEEALYYVGREALANVVKHARATRATVTLVRDTTVRVCVEDDGVGFGGPAGRFAYGLAGMRERVAALGGQLQLENRPGGGARVVAEVPVPDDKDC